MRLEGARNDGCRAAQDGPQELECSGSLLQRRGPCVSERHCRAWTFWAKRSSSQPKFRAYALAALAALDEPAAHMKLRKLMDEPSIEVRYGAFNALRTLDPTDPFLGLVRVMDRTEGRGR